MPNKHVLGRRIRTCQIMLGFQLSQWGRGIDTPPLRDEAEIYRVFSPCASGELTPSGRWGVEVMRCSIVEVFADRAERSEERRRERV